MSLSNLVWKFVDMAGGYIAAFRAVYLLQDSCRQSCTFGIETVPVTNVAEESVCLSICGVITYFNSCSKYIAIVIS